MDKAARKCLRLLTDQWLVLPLQNSSLGPSGNNDWPPSNSTLQRQLRKSVKAIRRKANINRTISNTRDHQNAYLSWKATRQQFVDHL